MASNNHNANLHPSSHWEAGPNQERIQRMDAALLTAMDTGEVPGDIYLESNDRRIVESAVALLSEAAGNGHQDKQKKASLGSLLAKKTVSLQGLETSQEGLKKLPKDILPPRKDVAQALDEAPSIATLIVAGVCEQRLPEKGHVVGKTVKKGAQSAVRGVFGVYDPEPKGAYDLRGAANRFIASKYGSAQVRSDTGTTRAPLLIHAAVERIGQHSHERLVDPANNLPVPNRNAAVASAKLFSQILAPNLSDAVDKEKVKTTYPPALTELARKIAEANQVTKNDLPTVTKLAKQQGVDLPTARDLYVQLKRRDADVIISRAVDDHATQQEQRRINARNDKLGQRVQAERQVERRRGLRVEAAEQSGKYNTYIVVPTYALEREAKEAQRKGNNSTLLDLTMALYEKGQAGDAQAQQAFNGIWQESSGELVGYLHHYRDDIKKGNFSPAEALFITTVGPEDFRGDSTLRAAVWELHNAFRRGHPDNKQAQALQAVVTDDLLDLSVGNLKSLSPAQAAILGKVRDQRSLRLHKATKDLPIGFFPPKFRARLQEIQAERSRLQRMQTVRYVGGMWRRNA